MRVIKCYLYIISCLILIGCGQKTLAPTEYIAWVQNPSNGLIKQKQIQPLEVDLLYKPYAYIIAEEEDNAISEVKYEKRKKELEGLDYFTLKLGIVGNRANIINYQISDLQEQQERLNYLSFGMQKDIKLVVDKDTFPCALYHFERSYDLSPIRTFVFAFERKEQQVEKDKTLILDLAYFKTGPIKLNYKAADIANIPLLHFNK